MNFKCPDERRLFAETKNATEEAFAMRLSALVKRGEILWWEYEPLKLRLAKKTFYTPDFGVLAKDGGLELIEVKGFWRDDARVKIKVAAATFPFFRFTAVTRQKGGGWHYEKIG